MNQQEYRGLRDRLQLPPAHADLARQLRKGEFLAYVGQYSYLVDCFATSTDWERNLFQTDDAIDSGDHDDAENLAVDLDALWPIDEEIDTDIGGWLATPSPEEQK